MTSATTTPTIEQPRVEEPTIDPDPPGDPTLHLIGGPYVSLGPRRVSVPEGSKRLVAFVALHRRPVERRHAAGALWPVGDDGRAAGNLRSALWRLRGAGIDILEADKWSIRVRDDVAVDVHSLSDWAARLVGGAAQTPDLALMPGWEDGLDLLAGWYEEWVLLERERLRQRMLHALEALSQRLVAERRFGEAVEAAMLAVGAEPLRESAQRALVEAHLAEGNRGEGWRSLRAYRDLLRRELGVDPSPDLLLLLPVEGRPRVAPPPVQLSRARTV
jgi:DNA-binding SARP family transcriptional activator